MLCVYDVILKIWPCKMYEHMNISVKVSGMQPDKYSNYSTVSGLSGRIVKFSIWCTPNGRQRVNSILILSMYNPYLK